MAALAGGDDHLGWYQLDHRKYLLYSGTFLFGMDVLIYPIDLLKTRQQFDLSKDASERSIYRLFKQVWHGEGIRGLYRGVAVMSVGSVPGSLTYFGCYEYSKAWLETKLHQQRGSNQPRPSDVWLINLAAGFVGDAASLVLHTPADVISQRLMVATHSRAVDTHAPTPRSVEVHGVVRSILHQEGARGFYRGFWASLATYAPSSAIWFATYEATKEAIYRRLNTHPASETHESTHGLKTAVHLVSGACAGLASVIVTNPLDVAKTRLQTMDMANPHDAKLLRKGFWYILYWTTRQEGLSGLYRGFQPRLWFAVIGSAMTFAGYEAAKQLALKEPSTVEES
eukprot:m.28184 g.28184  ORF g.28184 m.28184 type:complete len:340 (+) comp11812_c0_seq1:99-1118(+)